MCSVQEENEDVNAIPKSKISVDRICMKCKEVKAVVITRVNDPFCRGCFQVYIVHKFRATIGKSHLIRDGERVLIAFSGGPASSALLHLVQEGLSVRAHKRLRFIPSLVHIDETGILPITETEKGSATERVLAVMRGTGYPSYVCPLQQGLDLPPSCNSLEKVACLRVDEGKDTCTEDKQNDRLREVIATFKSVTAKQDFIRNLRNQLLTAIARSYGYGKVMFADTSSRLAVRILSDIGQGRGAHLADDTQFSDDRNGDIMFVRPIRELTSKECAMYNSLNNVEPVFIPSLTTMASSSTSIDHLTESFVTGLQAEFPSTVSNITRTAGKLGSQEKSEGNAVCSFCQSPLDTNVGEASALRSVELSRALSRGLHNIEGAVNRHKELGSPDDKSLHAKLCYGCRLTIRDMSNLSKFPSFATASKMNRAEMHNAIEDCLLGDS